MHVFPNSGIIFVQYILLDRLIVFAMWIIRLAYRIILRRVYRLLVESPV